MTQPAQHAPFVARFPIYTAAFCARESVLVLAGAGDDGLPVTAEWLLKAGFVLRAGRQSYGVGRYDAGNWLLTLKQAVFLQ